VDTRDELLVRIVDAAAPKINVEMNSDEQAIFPQELQSELNDFMLILSKIKLTVSNLSFFITIRNAFVFLDSDSSHSVIIQN
jgi:hypothetical protein